ncbi:MAG: extracellular solute-binding protein [Armatimonadetes bacterium]|nr:extracellular solute-binding protein [Armatimonadota bacterium]
MKARLFALIVLFLLALPLVAAGARQQETIVFWYGATQDERVAYERMVAQFERENPDIKVNAMLVPMSYIERKLILSVAGGVPPDVVRFYAHLGGELMSRGGLEPLDELVKRDKFDVQDFYKVGLTQNTYRGRLYGIPWILSPNALFYNKAAFREAGLDPNKPPRTWAELESYAMKLTKRNANGILTRVGYADFTYNPNNFAMYTWQMGGKLLTPDDRAPAFDSPEGRIALRWMKGFIEKEAGSVRKLQVFTGGFKGATQDPFGLGAVAMRVDSPFKIPDLKKYFPDLDYGVAQMPYKKQPASEVVGNSLVIPRGSKHREAAWRFVRFASSFEQMSNICKAAGRIPARVSAARSSRFYSDPRLRVFIDQIPSGHSVPVAPGWREVADKLTRSIELALKGQQTVDAALNDAATASTSILGRANEDMSRFPVLSWSKVGTVAVVVLIAAIAWAVAFVRKQTSHSSLERKDAKLFYLFAAPWIIGFVVFTFGAVAASLVISFCKWDTLSPAHFVGLRNYADLFTADARFYKALGVTLYYAIFSIPLAIVGGLGVSVLLNQKVRGIRVFRTVYYLPVVISGVATSVLWLYIFNPSNGILNRFLTLNILPWFTDGRLTWNPIWANPPAWLLDPKWALPAFIIMGFWGVGGAMVVYLAALQGVPEDLYEAAKLDGAGPWKQFRHVTLPLLTPAIFYQLVVGTMYALQMFTQAYIMSTMTGTSGGPEDSLLFYALYLFKNAFEFMKMGYASAMAWILFVIVLIITTIHLKSAKRWVYYEGVKEQ